MDNSLNTFNGFDYKPRTELVYGVDALDRLAQFVQEFNGQHVLIVTDKHIVQAGHVARAEHILQAAGIRVTVFDQVHENPTTDDVERAVTVARDAKVDTIVGLGGGSSLDTAKGCNFILTNGGTMHDYWGIGKATKPMLPFIAIPTTAGTGSECQSFALISDAKTHRKMACGDLKAAARVAILDPKLTLTQPRNVAACTGIDTIAHAIESIVTRKRNPLSMMFAREAFAMAEANFETVLSHGDDLEARGAMQLAAAYAGTAIENSMLGAAHSSANPLTAHFNVVHGWAVGLMLPHIIRYNARNPEAQEIYAGLAIFRSLATHHDAIEDAVDALIARIEQLLDVADVPASITACGVDTNAIGTLATDAAKEWTAQFNPREIKDNDFAELYTQALVDRGVKAG